MEQRGIVGIYLAAGSSTRMSADKRMLPFGKSTLGSVALNTALWSQLDRILVVTKVKDQLQWIDPLLFLKPLCEKWCHIACAEADQGQAHSIGCGLRAAQALKAEAVMILLADQPFVSRGMIDELIFQYKKSLQEKKYLSYVAASYQGIPRPPILFSSGMFPVMLKQQGDEGLRRILREGLCIDGMTIEYRNPRYFRDIDTQEDYTDCLKQIPRKEIRK